MILKTRGVVFRMTRFGDTSVIVNVFTEVFGLQSYLVNGVRSRSSRGKAALYQPLTLLDLVVYHKEHGGIMRIKEARCWYAYQHIGSDMRKTSIALFLDEVMNKAVKEQSHAQELADFLIDSLVMLDQTPVPENFHLYFLVQLSRHLGFGPHAPQEILAGRWLDESNEQALKRLLEATDHTQVMLSHSQRKSLLDELLLFYRSHLEGFGEMKSVAVLREVMS
ncbi:MAG: DNA repair protein RecO [Cyclobacteriaceae bacterium]|jgi:DNA repair protein RecO (recombination protein O)